MPPRSLLGGMSTRAVLVALLGLLVGACGGDGGDGAIIDEPEARAELRIAACISSVPTRTGHLGRYARRVVVRAVGGPGPRVIARREARNVGIALPFSVRRSLRHDTVQAAINREDRLPLTLASHRVRSGTVAAWLRCRDYRPVVHDRGPGSLWRDSESDARPGPATVVRLLPGIVVAGPPDAVRRATARLLSPSLAPPLDRATRAALRSPAAFVGASMVRQDCAAGRWAEQTTSTRARLHYLLNARGKAARTLRPARSEVLRTVRTANELRVDVRSDLDSDTIANFTGMYGTDERSSRLAC